MTVKSKEQAWQEVNKIFPTDYEKDYASSERAGYDIYRHPSLNYYSRICDLGDRLEVLIGEYGENVTNIWIEESKMIVEESDKSTEKRLEDALIGFVEDVCKNKSASEPELKAMTEAANVLHGLIRFDEEKAEAEEMRRMCKRK